MGSWLVVKGQLPNEAKIKNSPVSPLLARELLVYNGWRGQNSVGQPPYRPANMRPGCGRRKFSQVNIFFQKKRYFSRSRSLHRC